VEVAVREREVEMKKHVFEKQKESRYSVVLLFYFNLSHSFYSCHVALIHEMNRNNWSL
jgi:hypothetical protein